MAAEHLFALWTAGDMPSDQAVAIGLSANISTPAVQPLLATALAGEAARLRVSRADAAALVEDAAKFVEWARATTRVCALPVLARFAVAAAYDRAYQHILSEVIADNDYPRRWTSSSRRKVVRRLIPGSAVGSVRVAFYAKMLAPLLPATAPYVEGKASPVNIHDAYHGQRATWGCALDPIRPPMSAIRYAASLIEKFKGHGKLKVLAVEPGLSAAVMGLAWFLPGSQVHMFAPALGDAASPIRKADAVIVNLANARSMALVAAAIEGAAKTPSHTLTRDEIDPFWRQPASDPGHHAPSLVAIALDHLADDGLLVVLGDVASGVHHQAAALVAKEPTLHAIKLTPTGRPVQFGYEKPPWAPFGGLPATDRFVSAWQRMAP
jgi:hypothetical protein